MSHSQGHMASGWQSGHGLGQLWTPCSQLEALTKPAPLSRCSPYDVAGRGGNGPKRGWGPRSRIHNVSVRLRGSWEAGPEGCAQPHLQRPSGVRPWRQECGQSFEQRELARPAGRPYNHHCPRASKTGAQEGGGRTQCQTGAPMYPVKTGQPGSRGSLPPPWPKRTVANSN